MKMCRNQHPLVVKYASIIRTFRPIKLEFSEIMTAPANLICFKNKSVFFFEKEKIKYSLHFLFDDSIQDSFLDKAKIYKEQTKASFNLVGG